MFNNTKFENLIFPSLCKQILETDNTIRFSHLTLYGEILSFIILLIEPMHRMTSIYSIWSLTTKFVHRYCTQGNFDFLSAI
jgi:hypothetical protein